MARVDKTDSAVGVVRGTLAADIAQADWGKPLGVGFNATGKVVRGAGQTGVKGVIIADKTNYRAGQRCDVFKLAELLEVTGLAAGTQYYAAAADGVISTTNTGVLVGYTVEADRLVVHL